MNKWGLWIIVAAVVLIGGAFYLMSGQQSVTQIPPAGEPIIESPAPAGEVKSFEVEGKPFEFSLKEIRVNEGDRVRITFKNTEGMHDWVIDEFSARAKQIQAGETDTVEFVANKKGTFEYYCSVGNGFHRQQGMVGKLIVE
ncbi:hypothetical protein A2867_02045 [Candidatus Daviesbacteria bacterium RIFCSPHIGHO2_01_FULL_40_11]|uniref:EfeO-type cupredoxin-like domain-containing protein n=1 Tax=Candidatus Daviesbacteria bacterium RIFCSPHIGHO2_01_FULL_40_11 TaxID=1797762 RepID=A0A1F5JLT9_9BACT|nr:MAG: hypothetical protein A2867_02045 [Candidatus Daviesbacteria bacterium RIFCSPHIGHO2_01_FULL_40_11]